MFKATNIKGNTWLVTEVEGDTVVSTHKVAVKSGGIAEDAIATLHEASASPTSEEKAKQDKLNRTNSIKTECTKRILAVLDIYTASNIQGTAIAGELTGPEMATFRAGRFWVAATQDASRTAIVNGQDPVWPDVPEGIVELAAKF